MQQSPTPPKLRKIRFVLVSDTHSTYSKLLSGDVSIHADNNLTNQGSYSEFKKTLEWLEKAEAEVKIVIADLAPRLRRVVLVPANIACEVITTSLWASRSIPNRDSISTTKIGRAPNIASN